MHLIIIIIITNIVLIIIMMIIIMHLTLCQFIIYESLHVTLMSQPLLYFFSFSLVEGIVNVSMLPCNFFLWL